MILPDNTMVVRQTLNPVFERLGIPLRPIMESNAVEAILGSVGAGQGITFLNRFNVETEQQQGRVRFLPNLDRCPARATADHPECAGALQHSGDYAGRPPCGRP